MFKTYAISALFVLGLGTFAACTTSTPAESGEGGSDGVGGQGGSVELCETGDDVACCEDADCTAGEICNLDSSTCEAPACAVGEATECCEDADCAEGSVCNVDDGNVCEATCAVGEGTECCADTDCGDNAICDLEDNTCESLGGEVCATCDETNVCQSGLECHTYMDLYGGPDISECGPANYDGSVELCEEAAYYGTGCDANSVGAHCQMTGIGGTMDVYCSCEGYWTIPAM
jgi:hypothetical protein